VYNDSIGTYLSYCYIKLVYTGSGTLSFSPGTAEHKYRGFALNEPKYTLWECALFCSAAEPVVLGQWHSVKVSRINQEGVLQLDGGPHIRGTSGPPLNELNLELPLYVGGVM
jgi:hypothetical protein